MESDVNIKNVSNFISHSELKESAERRGHHWHIPYVVISTVGHVMYDATYGNRYFRKAFATLENVKTSE